MQVILPPRLRAVYPLYFCEQPLRQSEIATLFGVRQSAIAKRVRRIRELFEMANITLPMPGRCLRSVVPLSLSGAWDRGTREYLPMPGSN